MTIYLDIVFFENIAMNYLILIATAIIAKVKIKPAKILLSSAFGGLYSIIAYLIPISNLQNMLLKILIGLWINLQYFFY